MTVANALQQLEAIDARHANVRDHHVGLFPFHPREQGFGVAKALSCDAGLREGPFQDPAYGLVVVDDPYGATILHA